MINFDKDGIFYPERTLLLFELENDIALFAKYGYDIKIFLTDINKTVDYNTADYAFEVVECVERDESVEPSQLIISI